MGTSEESQALEPVLSLRFKEPNIVPVAVDYNELQRAVMPVVGFANGQVEPFASAFCVSVSMSLVLTAWHVLEDFVRDHAASLAAGTSHIAVVFETAEQLADGTYRGGPLPVFSASHIIGTDLAVLRLCDVYSGTELVQPTRLAGISFSPPPQDDYC